MEYLRPELSTKNPYYLSKHRYYELRHFCLHYNDWIRVQRYLLGQCGSKEKTDEFSDPTGELASLLADYSRSIEMVEKAAKAADEFLAPYILKNVTEGRSYINLNSKYGMPCCKEMFYDRCRRFFYILSNVKGL